MAMLADISNAHAKELAMAIRRKKKVHALTWPQVAAAVGVGVSTAKAWGSGARRPSRPHIAKLDRVFKKG